LKQSKYIRKLENLKSSDGNSQPGEKNRNHFIGTLVPYFDKIRSTVLDVVEATICPTEEADLCVDKDPKMALVLANDNPVMVTK